MARSRRFSLYAEALFIHSLRRSHQGPVPPTPFWLTLKNNGQLGVDVKQLVMACSPFGSGIYWWQRHCSAISSVFHIVLKLYIVNPFDFKEPSPLPHIAPPILGHWYRCIMSLRLFQHPDKTLVIITRSHVIQNFKAILILATGSETLVHNVA
jgi:hypothetical protein